MSFSFGKVMKHSHGADWEAYTEQSDFYFLANEVNDDQTKNAILLSNVSTETYQLLKDLLVPATQKNADVMYSVTVDRLQKHTKPEKSALVARYEFDNRSRQVGESVSDYIATLKHLASDCKFSDVTRAERLRNRLVSGIRDDNMLRDMLREKLDDLTIEIAVRRCLAIEQANRDVQVFQGETGKETKVDSLDNRTVKRCQETLTSDSLNVQTPYQSATGATNNTFQKDSKGMQTEANKKPPATSLHVMQGNEDAKRHDRTGLYRVSKGNYRKPISMTMEVENRELVMELDTDSAISVIGEEKYHEQLRHVPLESTTPQLHTYAGETVTPLGVLTVVS